jgi:hypothetical protein
VLFRSCQRLRQLWTESGNDQAKFVSILLKITEGEIDFGSGARQPVTRTADY